MTNAGTRATPERLPPLYVTSCRCNNPCENNQIDLRRASSQQRPRGGVGSRSRRQHVVDQRNPPPADRRSRRRTERPLHVLDALLAGEADLTSRRLDSLQQCGLERFAAPPRNLAGERGGLIE